MGCGTICSEDHRDSGDHTLCDALMIHVHGYLIFIVPTCSPLRKKKNCKHLVNTTMSHEFVAHRVKIQHISDNKENFRKRVMIMFLVRGRVRIKIRIRVRVGVKFNVSLYHWNNGRRSKCHTFVSDAKYIFTCFSTSLHPYLDNSPPGQFPTIQVLVLMSGFILW